uniref:Coenzyme F420 hydrogenase/dehydrogenase, beta subunit C-terminal domain n=1 Tax=Candidatus Cryptobacteroides bacterium TaxID=3085639 RepID=UPI004027BBA2
MSRVICNHDKCTGCAACKDVCPKQCITMQPDDLDALHPVVDESICINCGLCEKTCPNNRELSYKLPHKVLAAWSYDNEVRRTSASGGIACELYHYWIKNGGVATGVVFDRDEGCHFILLENESDIKAVQNSKYTFSDTAGIYKVVKQKLQAGISVLFIGVPCQVAGLYGFLKKEYDNLTTVDIICHGMPPATYLEQHIKSIEDKKKEYTHQLFFRDPKYYTYTFTFTLKNIKGKEFYNKKVLTRDNYQLGYHRALIYRENCYSCNYARKERISDLTIGDFSGLGRFAPFEYDKHNVSCILENTDKGSALLKKLNGALSMFERPACEAFEVEKQLKSPSVKHSRRSIFEKVYRKTRNYELASNIALKEEKKKAVKTAIILKIKVFLYNILVMLHIK